MASNGATHARVGFFMARHCLLGELNTGPRRVSDVLNDPSRQQLVLERVRVSRPDRPGEPFAEYERMIVRRPAIQAVLVMSEPPRPPEKRFSQYVAKTPVRLTIALPAMDVTGLFYVGGKIGDPLVLLFDAAETFVAISDAQVSWPNRPGGPLAVPVVLVNRAHVEAAAAAP
ncbi:MAG: hypothetical protein QOF01_1902 [Thermomicrobiales bacterium]|jgi:hypothetical protein|nr:hypothetical protein [Thermomicrobiales bacterium]MEA2595433.1 hypothetical protein [Thermomicrobiales bacterium]